MIPAQPVIPLTDEKLSYWRHEIRRARDKRTTMSERYGWQANLDRYLPAEATGPRKDDINTGVDFGDVERKKAALFFDTPTVALQTARPELAPVVALHQRLLNALLGPDHADVQSTSLQAIFACLCPAGIGPVVIGYHCTKQPIPAKVPVLDALGQPTIDPLTGQPRTTAQIVEVPIAESFYVSAISPSALLLPVDLRSTQYQKYAAWLGFDWRKPVSQVRREYQLPEDWLPKGAEGEKPHFFKDDPDGDDAAGDPHVTGAEIWYHADLDAAPGQVVHPDRLRRMVLVDDDDQPVIHQDSPHQDLDGEGRLTPDSMRGFPIAPLVLRDLTDSAYVPSDCAVTGPLTKEQNKYREIALQKRDHTRDVVLFDASKISPDGMDKVKKLPIGGFVPVVDGALDSGIQSVMAQVAKASQGRESYLDQDLIEGDRERILGISANQAGVVEKTRRTATESTLVQRNTDARFEQERQRVIRWFLNVTRRFDSLVVRYGDERLAVSILGPQNGARWFQAKQQGLLAGVYTYTVQIDSGTYLDVEADRQQFAQAYNLLAKNPFFNQQYLSRQWCMKMGWDPAEALVQPEPPKPEPPKLSLTFKGEDFIGPQGPIVLDLLAKMGVPIDAQAVRQSLVLQQLAQVQQALQGGSDGARGPTGGTHGGAADTADRLDQHQLDATGALSGPGPM